MSEIVRPTRDGIHGREYISTSVDIGRKLPHLAFVDGQLSVTSAAADRDSAAGDLRHHSRALAARAGECGRCGRRGRDRHAGGRPRTTTSRTEAATASHVVPLLAGNAGAAVGSRFAAPLVMVADRADVMAASDVAEAGASGSDRGDPRAGHADGRRARRGIGRRRGRSDPPGVRQPRSGKPSTPHPALSQSEREIMRGGTPATCCATFTARWSRRAPATR